MKLKKSFPLTRAEKRKYVMPTERDYEILKKVKQLEKSKLTKEEKNIMWLIKTQLERDWRKHLLQALNKLLKGHKK